MPSILWEDNLSLKKSTKPLKRPLRLLPRYCVLDFESSHLALLTFHTVLPPSFSGSVFLSGHSPLRYYINL